MKLGKNGQGTAVEKMAYENPLMKNEMLQRMHSYMVQCRAEANGFSGLEAIEVAALVHMRPGDTIAALGKHWIAARNGATSLVRMMAELFPQQGQQALPRVISGVPSGAALLGMGTGVAFGYKSQGGVTNAVVVLGDRGLLGRGNSPAVEYAGEQKLPILYVIETNLANDPPGRVQKLDDEINSTAAKSGLPAIPVDGHDAVAVYRVVQEAMVRARKGGGPTLIDCKTWRSKTRKGAQPAVDPIVQMEQYLSKRGLALRTPS